MAPFISDQKLADLKSLFSLAIRGGIVFCEETVDDTSEENINVAWECLVAAYSSPVGDLPIQQRKYHNLGHIAECIDTFNSWNTPRKDLGADFDKITLAIFYHDIYYKVDCKKNEKISAAQAICALSEFDICGSYLGDIYDLILATRHRNERFAHPMANVICDIDLYGLAKPYDQFSLASQAIADEFASVPVDDYIAGRIKWVESMLIRPRIFRTVYFYRLCEDSARKNLHAHLVELKAMQVKKVEVHVEAKEQSNAV